MSGSATTLASPKVVPLVARSSVQRAAVQSSSDPCIGDSIDGRYVLKRDLGRGAAGVVFEAEHTFTQRRVAIKFVSPDAPRSQIAQLRVRLIREAQALAAVRHPGIVDILDGGTTEDGTPYIVLEKLEGGRTLEGLLAARGKISQKDALAVILQLCDALGAAHQAGVVHRDVKPGNVIIVRDGYGFEHVKLVDFGVAQMKQAQQEKLTGIGALIGTPEYMAPEQLLALDDIDGRADIYALGIALFECLSGQVPYSGNYQQVLLQATSLDETPTLAQKCPDVDQALSSVVMKAIAKDRGDRYPNTQAFARAIIEAVPTARKMVTLFGPPPVPTPTAQAQQPVAADILQRRRAPRAPFATPVQIELANGEAIDGRSEDISEGGLLVICRNNCAAPQRVTVKFALPMEGTIVTCTANVQWARIQRPTDPESPRAIGLEFIDVPAGLRASVARYVTLMSR